MKGLTPWLIIVCLAFTNAAPPRNESQEIFRFQPEICVDERDLITVFTYYVNSVPEAINTYNSYSCDLNLALRNNRVHNTSLQTFSYSHVILSIRTRHSGQIFSVDMKNCNTKEITLDLPNNVRGIFFHDDKYYVVFWDVPCKELYCVAVYNSNGDVIKAATPINGLSASFDFRAEVNNKGLLIVNGFGSSGRINLHFIPFDNLSDAKLLYFVPRGGWFGLSTAEDKLGFCAFDDGKTVVNASKKIVCEQYDAEGKIKKMSTEVQIGKDDYAEFVTAGNLDDGMMLMMVEWQSQGLYNPIKHIRILYIDEHGKQGKLKDVDVVCSDDVSSQFYKNTDGEYCVTYICKDIEPQLAPFSQCFKKSELI